MTMTDPIADMLTRLRNANQAYHDSTSMPHSKIKVGIAQILKADVPLDELLMPAASVPSPECVASASPVCVCTPSTPRSPRCSVVSVSRSSPLARAC